MTFTYMEQRRIPMCNNARDKINIFRNRDILPVTFAYVLRKIVRVYLREKPPTKIVRKIKSSFKFNGQVIASTFERQFIYFIFCFAYYR